MPEELRCECGEALTFVEDVEPHAYGDAGSSQIIVPLASSIYECPRHGLWRIYISGAREHVVRNPEA